MNMSPAVLIAAAGPDHQDTIVRVAEGFSAFITNCLDGLPGANAAGLHSVASKAWDLRCEVREQLITFLQQRHPQSLPRRRTVVEPSHWLPAKDAAAAALPDRRIAEEQGTVPPEKENR